MPFCHLAFSASRPVERRYERVKVPSGTLGAVFRDRRWSRKLDQKQAAEEIGVTHATYCNWEVNRTGPDLRNIPAAIMFLGFDWRPQGANLGARIHYARTAAGLSIKQLATLLGADESTIRGWETGSHTPSSRSMAKIEEWLSRSAGLEPTTS